MQKRWHMLQADKKIIQELVEQLHISPVLAHVLVNRGIETPAGGSRFLFDSLEKTYDPFAMKGMEQAVQRIGQAIDKGERITIYGDYDVDGITSTSLLYQVLSDLGAAPSFYIPERQGEGYGLNSEALQLLADRHTDLLITVDCGISSYDIVSQVTDMDIIITDHHEPPQDIPPAYAVLNPKQPECPYPFKELAGVGVAYKVCQALWSRRLHDALPGYTELVALGTIADLVPLTDENRIIVQDGLRRMRQGQNIGIQALLKAASLTGDAVSAGRIAFTVAPRLNAAGRISHAGQGVRLLLESDPEKAALLADELSELNRERQEIEHDIARQAIAQIEQQGRQSDGVLIAFGCDWHAGVIGIAASRLVERYYRPSLVISVHDGIGKGSCRSISGFNMYAALQYAGDLLIQYGGHPMAAGFSVRETDIEDFRQRLNEYAAAHMTEEAYIPSVSIDMELKPKQVTLELIAELSRLEPYGMGNSRPVFSLYGSTVAEIRTMGRDKQHLRITVAGRDRAYLSGVGWSMAERCDKIRSGDRVDLAFQLEKNEFNGRSSPQLVLQDIHEPAADVHLDRTIMIDIYMALKKCIPDWGMPVRQLQTRLLPAEFDRYGSHTIYAAVLVLKEIGVLKIRQNSDGPAYYFPVLHEKMCLHMSPTYKKYGKV
ncbi:single-stranded-DNA-specific exonuclease RecJ [Megasphaera cerevisiae]|uniref:single-stranded-DNA-specific exonuclease RecJ n=1 Tax=Megasphaera cerevisiae TaxID=39029 RepID=UPI0009432EFC|nr:single-stranded-DNA-specific exonuclease RecJ [Megasphaera cerevisiae]OKY54421.1 single-stranded-DNA-specific exonuclease RecJ [Megasphaera cerevisiae]